MSKKTIYLYEDEGSSHLSLCSLEANFKCLSLPCKRINSDKILKENWQKESSILVFPGGRDLLYQQKLQGKGNALIREFVMEGGSYLGICAGAYYGTNYIEFAKGTPLEICENRELSFFPCKAIGPAFGPHTYCYENNKGIRASKISISNDQSQASLHLYHHGGCYFTGEERQYQVLGRYEELENKPAGIIFGKVGGGKVLLSGLHIEHSHTEIPTHVWQLRKTFFRLQASEIRRQHLFQNLLTKIL